MNRGALSIAAALAAGLFPACSSEPALEETRVRLQRFEAEPGRTVRLELVDQRTGHATAEQRGELSPVFALSFDGPPEGLSLTSGTWGAAEDLGDRSAPEAPGSLVVPTEGAPGPLSLLWEELSIPAAGVSELGLTAALPRGVDIRIFFRTRDDEQRGFADGFRASSFLDSVGSADSGRGELVYATSGHPDWHGEITALRFDPTPGRTPFWLGRLEARFREFELGSSPHGRDGHLLDAGLVELGWEHAADPGAARYQARRSSPAFEGRAQVVSVSTPRGAELGFSYALAPARERLTGEVTFEVFARRAGSGAELLFSDRRDPATDVGLWAHARLELPPSELETELLFRTRGGAASGRYHALWAVPTLFVPGERPPSVLLITADTLRADHVGAYGALDVATPNIDALAARGVRFDDCLTVSNTTSPAHASLFSGVFPKDHGVTTNRLVLPDAVLTLAETLAAAGRTTIASSGARHLNADISGFGQGFDYFLHTPPTHFVDAESGAIHSREGYRYADRIHEELFDVLDDVGPEPFFAWLHYYDPHTPYAPAKEWRDPRGLEPAEEGASDALDQLLDRRLETDADYGTFTPRKGSPFELSRQQQRGRLRQEFPVLDFLDDERDVETVRALYRAEIEELDHDLGRLFAHLESTGRLADTLIVFTADHGESLGEREIWFDHMGLYENTLRIPLILAGPGIPAERVVRGPVSSIDVAPTLATLFGFSLPDARGRSLVKVWGGSELPSSRTRWFEHGNGWEVGYRAGAEHVVFSLVPHVRDLTGRPIPADDLERQAEGEGEGSEEDSRRLVETWLQDRLDLGDALPASLGASDEASLRALGYAGD